MQHSNDDSNNGSPLTAPRYIPILFHLPISLQSTPNRIFRARFFLHPLLSRTFRAHVHLPLSFFTNEVTSYLQTQGANIPLVRCTSPIGHRFRVFDTSKYLDERSLTATQWAQTWASYRTFLDLQCDTEHFPSCAIMTRHSARNGRRTPSPSRSNGFRMTLNYILRVFLGTRDDLVSSLLRCPRRSRTIPTCRICSSSTHTGAGLQ
ncbi:hypothetical protein BDN72DRAFT_844170 [Pluteus cervinus]|uniref:Uncharacterized protein n=1 Tax=Pluteus cervinus TaxID=181527 RepID=A0ACD3ALK0_9AGAR|nr:hypothetical protein BDN72DRAFT_844170 [Pluteus cervinus]